MLWAECDGTDGRTGETAFLVGFRVVILDFVGACMSKSQARAASGSTSGLTAFFPALPCTAR